jgi:hypothetical protein
VSNDLRADSADASGGIDDIMYDTFDYAAHRIIGSADRVLARVADSSLPEADKAALRAFVGRFPTIAFHHDDEILLDHLERRNAVVLPASLRRIRQVLSGPGPEVQVRFDDFDQWTPHSDITDGDDDVIGLWYEDNFFGYLQAEDRDLLRNGAECYPILSATTGVTYVLAADLAHPDDVHIVDLCDEDVMDDRFAGRPGTESVFPAFSSYASMLAHIAQCRMPDGTVIRARSLS